MPLNKETEIVPLDEYLLYNICQLLWLKYSEKVKFYLMIVEFYLSDLTILNSIYTLREEVIIEFLMI